MEINKLLINNFWTGVLVIICILSVAVINTVSAEESSENEIILNFSFSEPTITEVNISNITYHNVSMNESNIISIPGLPMLPMKPLKILLPQKGVLESINITYDGNTSLGNSYNVKLSDMLNESNESFFNSSVPYPVNLSSEPNIQNFRGFSILIFNLHPVYYLGDTGEIYYYENMTVTIKTNNSSSVSPLFRGFLEDDVMMKQKVDDYTMNSTYISYPDLPENSSILNSEESYDYVIITPKSFVDPPPFPIDSREWDTFQDFSDYKNTTGIDSTVITTEYIYNNFDGEDNPEKIRNFIFDAYQNWGIEYVLLGGDIDIVPARYLWYKNTLADIDRTLPSDLYYSCLEGSYNENNNDYWGEPEDGEGGGDVNLYADVYVGRACVDDASDVNNFVKKTIAYDTTDSHDPYIKQALLVGLKKSCWRYGGDQKEEIKGECDELYFTEGIPQDRYIIDCLYDKVWMDWENSPWNPFGWPKAELTNRINDGVSIINLDGHGDWYRVIRMWNYFFSTKSWPIDIYTNEDVAKLSNNRYFFIYSGACLNGKFDHEEDDCLAEYFTVKTEHGAFAAVMNAREGHDFLGTDGPTQRYDRQFFDAIFGENILELGKANQDSKEDNLHYFGGGVPGDKEKLLMRKCYYELNLFGDPQISIKIPEVNNPPNPPTEPNFNSKSLRWYTFTTDAIDPNEDKVQFRLRCRKDGSNEYKDYDWDEKWYSSGETAYVTIWIPYGKYHVSAQARDEFFDESEWSDENLVTVSFNLDMQIESSTVVLQEQAQFNGLVSGGTAPYNSWFYDFGDGSNSTVQNTTHSYDTIGTYFVNLTVTDNKNITTNYTKIIDVVVLKSDFESSPGIALSVQQETFYFNDESKGYYDIVNWSWDFGDGNISYERNTSHVYSSEGAYNVSLTVTDSESNNDTFYQIVYIDSVSPIVSSVSSNSEIVGYGSNVTLSANISDNSCGVKIVKVNITYPDNSFVNYSMNYTNNNLFEFVFSDCYQFGEYSYIVWVADQANNNYCASENSFIVSRSFGYDQIGDSNQTILGTITGSVFRVNEKGVADNISVYLDPGNASSDYHYRCVIYNHNNSKLVGISEEKNISGVKGWQMFNFSVPKPVLLNDTDFVIGCWSDNYTVKMYYDNETGTEGYNDDGSSTLQGHYFIGVYNYTPDMIWFDHEDRKYSIYCCYTPDNTSPVITNVSDSPDPVGFGFNVTISADVVDDQSGIDFVKVNITYPNSTIVSFTMDSVGNDTYEYVFSNTWLKGQYNYLIWTVDNMNNSASSTGHSFTVSGQATISVCTIKDEYGPNEMINLTDPPGDPPYIGYEFLDNGDILHIWNKQNSYYFDTNSGIQLTNHYNEYWSHNVLMLGYYNNNQWHLIYRTDELTGFNKNINSDNETYVNATLWKDLSYGGYDFRLAIKYHLGVDDADLTVIPYIKNIGENEIPYNLGFGWEIKDIRIADVENDNYLQIYNGTGWEQILLNQALDKSYTDMDHNTTIRLICTNPPTYHLSRELYLSWNEDLTYKVTCKSRTGQNNAPVTLFIKIGTLDVDQEKYTHLYWLDSDDWLGITGNNRDLECGFDHSSVTFEKALNGTSFWAHGLWETHWGIVDLGQTYTVKKVRGRSAFFDDPINVNIYVSENKASWGTAVATGISTWQDTYSWVEVDTVDKDGRYIKIEIIDTETMYHALSFGNDMMPFKIFDVYGGINQMPVISNPYPENGSTGIVISPMSPMLKILVFDPENDIMNITWLSNSSGSWVPFGTNYSVGNGLYAQPLVNASVNGQWWYWNVSVNDGKSTNVSDVFKFYTGYQSKIKNTGSTDISGYLLIQVQYYNTSSSTWVVALDTVNETSPRTINSSEQFGLDTVFNGLVNTSSLSSFGSGSYRIYAAFRDPDGDVLVCNDETELEATYGFTVTFE